MPAHSKYPGARWYNLGGCVLVLIPDGPPDAPTQCAAVAVSRIHGKTYARCLEGVYRCEGQLITCTLPEKGTRRRLEHAARRIAMPELAHRLQSETKRTAGKP
jgi:hypothetical protein